LCGLTLINAPEWVTILGGNYERLVGDGRMNFFMTGSIRNESDRRTSTQGREVPTAAALAVGGPSDKRAVFLAQLPLAADIQESNMKANLRLGFEAPDKRWGIELWGTNITDERTQNVTFSIPLRESAGNRARGQFVQEPSTYGATLRTRF